VAPLTVPEGAMVVDNSEMTIEQTIAHMREIIKAK
jgi:cytidylate kinase